MSKEQIQAEIDKLEQKYQDAYEHFGFASHELIIIESEIFKLEQLLLKTQS